MLTPTQPVRAQTALCKPRTSTLSTTGRAYSLLSYPACTAKKLTPPPPHTIINATRSNTTYSTCTTNFTFHTQATFILARSMLIDTLLNFMCNENMDAT